MAGRRVVLRRLTSLRAFAALLVFVYHLGHDGLIADRYPFKAGYTGVTFFFILSGFVLTWSTPASMSAARFLRNRFARVYPSTLVTILAAVVVPVTSFGISAAGVVCSVFLVQAWVPQYSTAFGANSVVWSLSCEAAFYLAFPFIVPRLRRASTGRRAAMVGAYFGTATVVVAAIALRGHSNTLSIVAFANPAIRFGEFLVGVLAALEIKDGRRLPGGAAAGLAFLSLLLVGATRAYPLPNALLVPLFTAVIVVAAQRDLDRPDGFLAGRWLVYAGEVSFCFYLVHELILLNVRHSVGHGGSAVAAACLAAAVVAAVALHHLVEMPVQGLIRDGHSGQFVAQLGRVVGQLGERDGDGGGVGAGGQVVAVVPDEDGLDEDVADAEAAGHTHTGK